MMLCSRRVVGTKTRRPHVAVAVVGDDVEQTSTTVLALARAARAADMPTRVFRHYEAYPSLEPIPETLPNRALPRASIEASRVDLTICACPLQHPQVRPPVAPAGLCDTALCLLPAGTDFGRLDQLLLRLRAQGLPLTGLGYFGSLGDEHLRDLREHLYLHNFAGDELAIRPLDSRDPKARVATLRAVLDDFDRVSAHARDRPTGPLPVLTIGDVHPVTRSTAYAIVRLWQGQLFPGAKLQLTGIRRDYPVTTLVLQQRMSMQAQPLPVGHLQLMHIQHRPGVRIVPGMMLFEPGTLQRSRTCVAYVETWSPPLPRGLTLHLGQRRLPVALSWQQPARADAPRLAKLEFGTPLHMPAGTAFGLSHGEMLLATGVVEQAGAPCPADRNAPSPSPTRRDT